MKINIEFELTPRNSDTLHPSNEEMKQAIIGHLRYVCNKAIHVSTPGDEPGFTELVTYNIKEIR